MTKANYAYTTAAFVVNTIGSGNYGDGTLQATIYDPRADAGEAIPSAVAARTFGDIVLPSVTNHVTKKGDAWPASTFPLARKAQPKAAANGSSPESLLEALTIFSTMSKRQQQDFVKAAANAA